MKKSLYSFFENHYSEYLVACIDSQLVGYIHFAIDIGTPSLLEVFVLPEHRKKNIADSLLKEACIRLDSSFAFLTVWADNEASRNFVTSRGFSICTSEFVIECPDNDVEYDTEAITLMTYSDLEKLWKQKRMMHHRPYDGIRYYICRTGENVTTLTCCKLKNRLTVTIEGLTTVAVDKCCAFISHLICDTCCDFAIVRVRNSIEYNLPLLHTRDFYVKELT